MRNGGADWIMERLPPIEAIPIPKEPDMYGASHLIAASIGRRTPAPSQAHWQHGWQYTDPVYPAELVNDSGSDQVYLVATENLVGFLRQHGYPNAFAVGMPFVYADHVQAERRPGSLLVMPPHSLSYTQHSWNQVAYAEEIAALRPHFSLIAACISASCVKKGYWIETFAKYDIPWIIGAAPEDRNSLVRMHTLFRSFEYMTTNALGSHVAYAAYCGCRVSIHGTYASYKREDFEGMSYYQRYPEILEVVIEGAREAAVRAAFPELFTTPQHAVERRAWAAAMLGAENRKSGHVIARLLGWPPPVTTVAYEYLRNLPAARKYKELRERVWR